MDQKKILVVDDEPQILKVVDARLHKEGYTVVTAADGEQALKKFAEQVPDLVVLDLMLPKLDGFEVCREIHKTSTVPIIILSAKGDEVDKIVGFQLGVDDYLTKPFSPSELALRIKAVLRRTAGRGAQHEQETTAVACGELHIDRQKRVVKVRGVPVDLTAKEFEFLWLLATHPEYVFTREQLLYQIWESDYTGDLNNVTVLVSRLREKIEQDPANPVYIKTVWGVGYKLGVITA